MTLTKNVEEIKSVLIAITCSIEESWEDCHLYPKCTIQELHHILEEKFPKYLPNFDATLEQEGHGAYSETTKYTENVIDVLDRSFHWDNSGKMVPENYKEQAKIIAEMYMLKDESLHSLEKTIKKAIADTVDDDEDEAKDSHLYELIKSAASTHAWAKDVIKEGLFDFEE